MKQPRPREIFYGNVTARQPCRVSRTSVKEKKRLLNDFGITVTETMETALNNAKTAIELDRIALGMIDLKLGYR